MARRGKRKNIVNYENTIYNRESPPKTLPEYVQAKGYLSVTDLVSPLWCEYSFHYGILGMRHLPVSQRPKEISTPSGNVIKQDKHAAQQREKVLKGGRKVHEKLEKEIHPVKVKIQTTTREDEWALRLLRLITSLKTLLENGCAREIPIFGFVHGQLVMGVIDEINRMPLSIRTNRYLDQVDNQEKPDSKPISNFFTSDKSEEMEEMQKLDEKEPVIHSNSTKRWSSQEEWKKEKRRKDAMSKMMKVSPKKTQAKNKKKILEQGQSNLSNFFGRNSSASTSTIAKEEEKPNQRFGYFLIDSKTRLGNQLPPIEDQQPARLQCMLYKRLFDGLVLGMVDGAHPQIPQKEAEILELDENSTPIEPSELFPFLNLNASQSLSEEFVRDAEDLLNGYGETLQGYGQVCTLVTVANLLSDTLEELARSARVGLGWDDSDSVASGVLQHSLKLTFRKRKGFFRPRDGYESGRGRRSQPSRAAKQTSLTDEKGEDVEKVIEKDQKPLLKEGEGEETSIAVALQMGIDDDILQAAIEDEILRDNGVVIPESSPSVPLSEKRMDNNEKPEEIETGNIKKDPNILDTVSFFHNPFRLENHLQDMMNLWKGERKMRGVKMAQSWRCNRCEFRADCEWREEKGQEEIENLMLRKKVDQIAQTIDQQPIGPSDPDGKNSNDDEQMKELDRQSTQEDHLMESQPKTIFKQQDLDSEDELWSQFEEIASDDLKD